MSEVRTDRQELRALVKLAWPLALGQVGWALMTFADTVILGQVGQNPLGGGGLGGSLFFALTVLGIGLALGFDPLMAQAIGAREPHRARAWMWQAVYLVTLASAVLIVPLFFLRSHLLSLGVDAGVAKEASDYILWRAPSLPFVLYFAVTRGFLQAVGRTRSIGLAAVLCNLLNIAGDLVLVRGGAWLPEWAGPLRGVPSMGAGGSALTTTVCSVLQWAIAAVAVTRVREGRQLPPRPSRLAQVEALRVGAPISLQLGAEVGVFALTAFFAARIGAASSAAHQVAIAFSSLTFNACLGIGQAGSARVAWAVGALRTEGVRRAGRVAFGLGGGLMTVSAVAFVVFPGELLALLRIEPQVTAVAAPLMRIAGVFQVFDGLQAVGAGVLRGAGDTAFASLSNVICHYAIGLPVGLVLGFTLGWAVSGLWVGLCVGLAAVAISLMQRFFRLAAKPIAPLPQTG